MSEKQNDGGPAFPAPWHPEMGWSPRQAPPGMSLRDWFAGQFAASAFVNAENLSLASNEELTEAFSFISRTSYKMADAMLAEREKRGKT